MNTWQLLKEIQNVLQDAVWAGASNSVFGNVAVTIGPISDMGSVLRFPAALIRPADLAVDPQHDSQLSDLLRQNVIVRLLVGVVGDAVGQAALIGGNWAAGTAGAQESSGRGLLEIEEALFDSIAFLGRDDGVEIELRSGSAAGLIAVEETVYVVYRDYEFESWVTASRDYPPAREFTGSVSGSDVTLTWVNPE